MTTRQAVLILVKEVEAWEQDNMESYVQEALTYLYKHVLVNKPIEDRLHKIINGKLVSK